MYNDMFLHLHRDSWSDQKDIAVTCTGQNNYPQNPNGVRNSEILKNTAAPSYGELFSLSTGAAEIFIFIYFESAIAVLFCFFT